MFADVSATRIPDDVRERIKDGHLGQFKILGVIGAGGMGAVFKCKDRKLRRDVAVKLLLHTGDGRNVQRFLAEARTLARLSHPNIVQVYDVGYDGHVPYFVMEHVVGESLAQRLDRLGRMAIDDARDVIAQTARGLAAVHALGIIHRDVKAANVIVRSDGVAKLLDFGIARPVENAPALTSSGLVMGTPSSMAPEQLRGQDLDQRADVYSLGVLLYQILAGQRPYAGEDPNKLAEQQDSAPPRPIRELRPDVPDDLVKVIDRALACKRDDRYWNCEELLLDLEDGLLEAGRGDTARNADLVRENAAVRARARRRPAMLAGFALIGVVIGAGGLRLGRGCIACEPPVAGVEGAPDRAALPTGVFLWHDGSGWHLRAQCTDARSELAGTIRVTGGRITRVRGIDDASTDALVIDGRREVRFRFEDAGNGKGLDFTTDGGCLEVSVTADGIAIPEFLRLGRQGAPADALPVRYCPD